MSILHSHTLLLRSTQSNGIIMVIQALVMPSLETTLEGPRLVGFPFNTCSFNLFIYLFIGTHEVL